MKRTPLKPRKKPLKRGKPPTRSPLVHRVVAKIKKRGRSRFPKRRDVAYREWIASLPCLLVGRILWLGICPEHRCQGTVEATHVKSRGAAGLDYGNLVPLCGIEHRGQHQIGIRSWATAWFGENGLAELRRIAAETYPAMYQKSVSLGWKPGGEF